MLSDLYAGSLADADRRLETTPLSVVERMALSRQPALDAMAALAPSETIKVLAEVKRASPSRGTMASIPDPAALAEIYSTNGASAISVLTEERKCLGSLADLEAVRERVAVPLLRKDFIATIIHECIHLLEPEWSEKKVLYAESRVINTVSDIDIVRLLALIVKKL